MEKTKKTNGIYFASLVLGIISIVVGAIPIIGFILGMIALIISIIAMKKQKKSSVKNTIVIVGFISSIVGFIISIIITIFLIVPLMMYIYTSSTAQIDMHTEAAAAYNSVYEAYEGVHTGSSVLFLCNIVDRHNMSNSVERNIKVVKDPIYIPSNYTNTTQILSSSITDIKKEIFLSRNYNVIFVYDTNGYITWIGIRDVN